MKKIILFLTVAMASYSAYSQNTYPWPSTGNVGIGTTSPGGMLQVNDPSGNMRLQVAVTKGIWVNNEINGGTPSNNGPIFINYSSVNNTLLNSNGGYVGIGVTAPGDLFQVNDASSGVLRFQVASTKGVWVNNEVNGGNPSAPGSLFLNYSSTGNTLLNALGGYVGIGTTVPDAKLSVKGTIHTQEVKVDMLNWSDYVFDKAYTLPPLSLVKDYIDQNHHLPEIPSETEVIKNGINLGEIVKVQTKKIEELTLYLIDKDQQLTDQQKQINELKEQLKSITKYLPKN